MKQLGMIHLFNFMDEVLSEALEVSLEEYVEVAEKLDEKDMGLIVDLMFSEDLDDREEGKKLYNKKSKELK